jgi:hypothetical protein
MKPVILFFTALLFAASVFGQEAEKEKRKFAFDEFLISGNYSIASSDASKGRFGGGAGMYHTSRLSMRWNYMYGVEYNYTSLFVEEVSYPFNLHRFEKDVTFHIHTISLMPVAFRFSMGKNIKYFFETGLSFGIVIADKRGEAYVKNKVGGEYTPVDIEGRKGVDVAQSFGTGMRIPMKNIEWIVKTDYKMGLSLIRGNEFYRYCRLSVGLRI